MDWDKCHRSGDNDAVIEEMQEKMKEMTRQIANFETKVGTTYRDKPGSPYSLRWDRRNTDPWRSVEHLNPRTLADYRARERDEDEQRRRDEEDRRRRDEEDRRRREEDDRKRREDEERRCRDDNIDRDRRRDGYRGGDSYGRGDRAEQYPHSPRDQYPHSPRYGGGAEGYRSLDNFNSRDREDSRGRWESDRDRRDGYRSGYERNEALAVRSGLDLYRSYQFEIDTADGRKQRVAGVCHKATIEVEGLRVTMPVFAVRDCSAELLLGRTWLSHVHAVTIERPDGSHMLSIKRPDGGRIMMETVEPRDPRNRAVLAAGSRVPVALASRSLIFREKKYGPLLTEEEGQIVEVEDLGTRKVKPAAVARERSALDGLSEEEIVREIKEKKRKEPQRLTEKRIAEMDIGDENLTQPEKERVLEVLKSCDKAITFSDAERGRIDPRCAKPARIYMIPHTLWNDAGWKFAQKEKEEVISLLKEKMTSHVVEPCDSTYANRWFFLRKPNEKIRWIQDLQKVNAVAIRDVGSVPLADLLAERAAGRSIYYVSDLFSGYDEIPLDPRDRHLTAMHTPLGLVQMMVVPMGWTNGVAVFQRAMVAVLKDFIPDKVEVFLDDFPIKGPVLKDETEVAPGVRRFVEQHMTDIYAILEQQDEANLTVSGTKSRWVVSTIKILVFICDAKGRRPDPGKLEKLLNWPTPLHGATEVRQFLGVVGYWQIFIRGYAEKAEPLRTLLRKTEKFYWDFSQELGVQSLKEEFKEGGRILGVPFFEDETDRPFIVSTDAGPCSVGGLLSQKDADGKERPLRFESRTLNTAERNYTQFKKEVLAVLRCLDTFRHYIYGRRFVLRVDPTAVASVLQKDFSLTDPTIALWLIRIRLYDYTVERISEAKNAVADGLSRIPIEAERRISVAALTMTELRRTDRFLVNLYEGKYRTIGLHLSGVESSESEIMRQAAQYCLRVGHLFRQPVGAGMPLRVVCDPEEKQSIVAELHDGVVGGHRGVKGTYEKVRRLYWWEE
ncbi:hypothetical protein CBR_g28547 [Chara braunii]|uniref:Reverse transcriptase n=1 Tax=Chara braunii TaxID=69332 RepID=A0A388JW80_CHABU|nr:hypothetical protein CBR_g28547 [Chara braunii]|eukprot:GBG62071.1 hypothetical protein CBR_g28547 [Chara braunii]